MSAHEYGLTDALADGLIKTSVVYQPDIKTVQLTYSKPKTFPTATQTGYGKS